MSTDDELTEIRFHWSSAYLIERIGERYVAQRRDKTRGTVSAVTAAELWPLIRADYEAQPVPRTEGTDQ